MTDDRLPLAELTKKTGDGDFLRTVAESVLQIIMDADTGGLIRWHDQRRSTGGYAAKPQGGDTRSRRIEAHRDPVLALYGSRRDITLDELRRELGQAGDDGSDLDAAPLLRPAWDHAQTYGPSRPARMKLDDVLVCINVSGPQGVSPGQDGSRASRAS